MSNSLLISPEQAAAMLGIARQTLAKWRWAGFGPPFVKVGRKIAYPQRELDKWVAERTYHSTTEYPNEVR